MKYTKDQLKEMALTVLEDYDKGGMQSRMFFATMMARTGLTLEAVLYKTKELANG